MAIVLKTMILIILVLARNNLVLSNYQDPLKI